MERRERRIWKRERRRNDGEEREREEENDGEEREVE